MNKLNKEETSEIDIIGEYLKTALQNTNLKIHKGIRHKQLIIRNNTYCLSIIQADTTITISDFAAYNGIKIDLNNPNALEELKNTLVKILKLK